MSLQLITDSHIISSLSSSMITDHSGCSSVLLDQESLIQICQFCDFEELNNLLKVNAIYRRLLQNEPRAWCNATLTAEIQRCAKYSIDGDTRLALHAYFVLHPAARQVGKVKWKYQRAACQDMELRDMEQYLCHVNEFKLEWLRFSDGSNYILHTLLCPYTNQFATSLRKLVLVNCPEWPVAATTLLTSDNLPALRYFRVRLAAFVPVANDLMQVFSQLRLLHELRVDHENKDRTRLCCTPHFFQPLSTMKQLKSFTTNFYMTAAVLQQLNLFLPGCILNISLLNGEASTHNVSLLLAAQELHEAGIEVTVGTNAALNREMVDALLTHARGFRRSFVLDQDAKVENWFLNDRNRWRLIGQCAMLNELVLHCSIPVRIDVNCVRALRPIYKQLQIFKLINIIVDAQLLQQLEIEIKQMTRLTNKDNLINLQWESTN